MPLDRTEELKPRREINGLVGYYGVPPSVHTEMRLSNSAPALLTAPELSLLSGRQDTRPHLRRLEVYRIVKV